MKYVLAIDEGTTGVRALIFDASSAVVGRAYQELAPSYPQPGWVELDAEGIWSATRAVCARALEAAQLTLQVADDGRGFGPATPAGHIACGNGLANMQQRLVEIGGVCEIQSEPGCGTRVTFTVPCAQYRHSK